ncbi:MAG: sigma-54 dependent transcriptional regulator [Candidatus Latescibacterota bacterium]
MDERAKPWPQTDPASGRADGQGEATTGEAAGRARLLLVDDVPANLNVLCEMMHDEGYHISVAMSGSEALELAAQVVPDLVLLDVVMPGMDGYEVCRHLHAREATAQVPVLFVTARDLPEAVVEGFRAGAVDYITKPFRAEEVLARVRTHLRLHELSCCLAEHNRLLAERNAQLEEEIAQRQRLRGHLSLLSEREAEHWGLEGFVGRSPTLRRIFDEVRLLQESAGTSVLITGESGTGKELIARAIHFGSPRREGPFVPVNCAALPRELTESLFFGHVRGAFTGAAGDRVGYFEMAHEGTLFLDEIGEMPGELQSRLLRVLEDRRVQRVGESTERAVDVRVLAATNQDLLQRIRQGGFRQDLYFRLARFTVTAPSLRQRREDIPLLAAHFIELFSREMGREPAGISDEAVALLRDHPFPGNVRELKNVVERAVIESRGAQVQAWHVHLTPALTAALEEGAGTVATPSSRPADLPLNLDAAVQQTELALVRRGLERTGNNVAETARLLGTNRNRIYRTLEQEKSSAA